MDPCPTLSYSAYGSGLRLDSHPSRWSIGWIIMELRSQTEVSGSSAKPRATSPGRDLAADRETDDYGVKVTSSVGLPSSSTTTTRVGKLASHIHPVQGGWDRASIPSARSESTGSAVGSPEGSQPRRQGETRESSDVGEAATRDRWFPVAAAIGGGWSASSDEGSHLTPGTIHDFSPCQFLSRFVNKLWREDGVEFCFFHWVAWSPLQHFRTKVRVCNLKAVGLYLAKLCETENNHWTFN